MIRQMEDQLCDEIDELQTRIRELEAENAKVLAEVEQLKKILREAVDNIEDMIILVKNF